MVHGGKSQETKAGIKEKENSVQGKRE